MQNAQNAQGETEIEVGEEMCIYVNIDIFFIDINQFKKSSYRYTYKYFGMTWTIPGFVFDIADRTSKVKR